MTNRRPTILLASFVVAALAFGLTAFLLDEEKGWNHPGQAVSNITWMIGLLCVLGFVLTVLALLTQRIRHRDRAPR